MNAGLATVSDDDDAVRESRVRRRTSRLHSAASGRQTASGSSRSHGVTRQRQLEADEAYARRLQAQYDAQFYVEQQQRRRREAAAQRRHTRAQANSYRPPTPSLPPRRREYSETTDDDDDDTEENELQLPLGALVDIIERSHPSDGNLNHYSRRRRNSQGRASPNGPTTLLAVRRYFQEANLDADLFPDGNISVLDFETLLELADELGDAAPSMSSAEINRLPTTVFRQMSTSMDVVDMTGALSSASASSSSSSSSSSAYGDDAPTCAICMEKFVEGDVQRNLPCFHAFHKDCVDVWLKQKSSCPVCRVDARRASPGSPLRE